MEWAVQELTEWPKYPRGSREQLLHRECGPSLIWKDSDWNCVLHSLEATSFSTHHVGHLCAGRLPS